MGVKNEYLLIATFYFYGSFHVINLNLFSTLLNFIEKEGCSFGEYFSGHQSVTLNSGLWLHDDFFQKIANSCVNYILQDFIQAVLFLGK